MKKVSQRRARRSFNPKRSSLSFADFSDYRDVVLSKVLSLIRLTKEKSCYYAGAIFLIAPGIFLDLSSAVFVDVRVGYYRVPVLG